MNTFLNIILTVIFVTFCLPTYAQEGHINLITSTNEIRTGSEFYIDVEVNEAPKVFGVHLILEYSSDTFSLVSSGTDTQGTHPIVAGDFFEPDTLFTLRNHGNKQSGEIEYIVSQVTPAKDKQGKGQIARIFFKAHAQSNTGTLAIKLAKFGSREGQAFDFKVGEPLTLKFNQTYDEMSPPLYTTWSDTNLWMLAVLILASVVCCGIALKRKIDQTSFI